MSSFHTQILTPEGAAFEGETGSVRVPGAQGSFEVRKDHASLISLMDIGVARLIDSSGKEFKFAISGGFTEVHNNTVILMAETAEAQQKIDVDRAKRAKEVAQEALEKRRSDLSEHQAELKMRRALNRIKVADL